MKKSVEILGLPIISITEGRELGMSKSLLIDAKNGKVAAITIEDEDWYRGVKLIPYESIIAIGEDAVTITHSENILNLDEAGDYERLLVENVRVIGTKAITKTGRIQGNITEVLIGDGGKIEKCEITAPNGEIKEVSAAQISIFGKQVTVVDIEGEKKNNSVTATPTFETFKEEEPPQDVWTPATNELPAETVETPAELSDTSDAVTVETTEVPVEPVEEPAETLPIDIMETPVDTTAMSDILEPPAEPVEATNIPEPLAEPIEATNIPEPPAETVEATNEIAETLTENLNISSPVAEGKENALTPEPAPQVANEENPADKSQPSDEDRKLATMTKQAEDLRAAIKKAAASKSAKEPKTTKNAVDERRRRVLLGKHATKTIMAESGTVVVEAGAEVTEEVLQRARLSNKFIELSMNVQ